MKKLVMTAAMFAVCVAQALTLAEARGKIGECIADAKVMTSTMKELSPADQVAFVAEVNAAIASMPGSTEAMVATALNVNRAAMVGAAKGNVSSILAEVYATVPAEALPAITESFATDLFNRSADSTVTYTDEQFEKIATTIMKKVVERLTSVEGGDARAICAAAMMVKASGDTPSAGIVDAVVAVLPEATQENAKKQILAMTSPDAQDSSYDTVVEEANADNPHPKFDVIIRIAGPQRLDALIADVNDGMPELHGYAEHLNSQRPYDIDNIIEPATTGGAVVEPKGDGTIDEPQGYQNQTIY